MLLSSGRETKTEKKKEKENYLSLVVYLSAGWLETLFRTAEITWFSYICTCSLINLFSAQYSLAFTNHGGTSSYVIIRDLAFSLKAFTLCLWMKTDDREHSGTLFSYSTTSQSNELVLYNYQNFELYVHGYKRWEWSKTEKKDRSVFFRW